MRAAGWSWTRAARRSAPTARPGRRGWGRLPAYPDARVVQLSEHHAVVDLHGAALPALGSRVDLVPNHVCNAVNLADVLWADDTAAWRGGPRPQLLTTPLRSAACCCVAPPSPGRHRCPGHRPGPPRRLRQRQRQERHRTPARPPGRRPARRPRAYTGGGQGVPGRSTRRRRRRLPGTVDVTMKTNAGDIPITLDAAATPCRQLVRVARQPGLLRRHPMPPAHHAGHLRPPVR